MSAIGGRRQGARGTTGIVRLLSLTSTAVQTSNFVLPGGRESLNTCLPTSLGTDRIGSDRPGVGLEEAETLHQSRLAYHNRSDIDTSSKEGCTSYKFQDCSSFESRVLSNGSLTSAPPRPRPRIYPCTDGSLLGHGQQRACRSSAYRRGGQRRRHSYRSSGEFCGSHRGIGREQRQHRHDRYPFGLPPVALGGSDRRAVRRGPKTGNCWCWASCCDRGVSACWMEPRSPFFLPCVGCRVVFGRALGSHVLGRGGDVGY